MERLGNDGEEKWHSILNGFVTDQNRGMIKGYRGWQDNMAILNEDVPFDTKTLAAKMQGKKAWPLAQLQPPRQAVPGVLGSNPQRNLRKPRH